MCLRGTCLHCSSLRFGRIVSFLRPGLWEAAETVRADPPGRRVCSAIGGGGDRCRMSPRPLLCELGGGTCCGARRGRRRTTSAVGAEPIGQPRPQTAGHGARSATRHLCIGLGAWTARRVGRTAGGGTYHLHAGMWRVASSPRLRCERGESGSVQLGGCRLSVLFPREEPVSPAVSQKVASSGPEVDLPSLWLTPHTQQHRCWANASSARPPPRAPLPPRPHPRIRAMRRRTTPWRSRSMRPCATR